jgi:hypothetical protein
MNTVSRVMKANKEGENAPTPKNGRQAVITKKIGGFVINLYNKIDI